jgi:hypothetical protein
MLPWMSCLYIRRSKASDELKASISRCVLVLNRPDQAFSVLGDFFCFFVTLFPNYER